MNHTGGFIAHYADGPRVIQVGFVDTDGSLVVIPRGAFDDAARWIAEQEHEEWRRRVDAKAKDLYDHLVENDIEVICTLPRKED